MMKALLMTFGCQMNEYDSGRLADLLRRDGWEITADRDAADFIFINTCSIREKAAQRVLSHLRQLRPLKAKKPSLVIALGGCVAEQEGANLLRDYPGLLDLAVGPQHLPEIPALLRKWAGGSHALVGAGARPAWSGENLTALGLEPAALASENALTASVTIMQGCDNYCAYCVVPYLRGPEMSRQPADILAEVKALLDGGAKDVNLLGQNVNSYGRGLAEAITFPQLLERVAALGVPRLRFTTSHPKDLSPELIRLFGTLPALCESLHLPVQSGSDKILRSMRRAYGRERYLELVAALRAACPAIALYTDVIVGFPGETRSDFDDTMSLLETVRYDALFSFKYSDRPRTRASEMPDKIPEEEKGRRLAILQARQKQISLEKNEALIGQTLEVLVESPSRRVAGQLTGRARNFKMAHFDGPPDLIGRFVPVRVEAASAVSLRGTLA